MKKLVVAVMLAFIMSAAGLYGEKAKGELGEFSVQFDGLGKLDYTAFDSVSNCLADLGESAREFSIMLSNVYPNNTSLDSRVIRQTLALKAVACSTVYFSGNRLLVTINLFDQTTKTWTTLIFEVGR